MVFTLSKAFLSPYYHKAHQKTHLQRPPDRLDSAFFFIYSGAWIPQPSSLNHKLSLTLPASNFQPAFILWHSHTAPTLWTTLNTKINQRFDFLCIQSNHHIFANQKSWNTTEPEVPELRLSCGIFIDIFFNIGITLFRKILFRCFAMRSCLCRIHCNGFHSYEPPRLFGFN